MKSGLHKLGFIAFIFIIVCLSVEHLFAQEPPLVDGDCQEYSRLKAKRLHLTVSKDVELHLYQDKYYVWMCYSYPDGSFGMVDLRLKTAIVPEPVNLHISAQLGEWPANKPELAPQNPESELWWNAKGWAANPIWINGMDKSNDKLRYRFKNAKAREIQLSKRRFGRGNWSFSMEIRNIKGSDGKPYDVVFPKAGEFYSLKIF